MERSLTLPHRAEKFFYCKNFVSKSGVRNPDRSLMRLVGKLDDPVVNKSKVIAKLRRLASGAFDAGMGGQAGKNELLNSPVAKLLIEVRSLKGIERPMSIGRRENVSACRRAERPRPLNAER
jgi:hypothetical protein